VTGVTGVVGVTGTNSDALPTSTVTTTAPETSDISDNKRADADTGGVAGAGAAAIAGAGAVAVAGAAVAAAVAVAGPVKTVSNATLQRWVYMLNFKARNHNTLNKGIVLSKFRECCPKYARQDYKTAKVCMFVCVCRYVYIFR
jgi:hypothetical protein